jgi:aryl carrier-like protein
LEFRGRLDDQVKVRGYRIEPGEVEAVLARHPAVAAAAVVVDAGQATGERREARLVAYLVGAGGVAPEADEVLAFTTRALPPYMVPQALYAVDALPRTVGGKVDRRALARSEARRLDAERPTVAPRTPLEKEIAELWRPLLEVPEGEVLGVHDSFFDRGGNSLLATQLMSRFRRRFEVELALLDLLQNPTVAGLAELVEVARRSAEAARRGGAAGGRGGDDGDREEGTL